MKTRTWLTPKKKRKNESEGKLTHLKPFALGKGNHNPLPHTGGKKGKNRGRKKDDGRKVRISAGEKRSTNVLASKKGRTREEGASPLMSRRKKEDSTAIGKRKGIIKGNRKTVNWRRGRKDFSKCFGGKGKGLVLTKERRGVAELQKREERAYQFSQGGEGKERKEKPDERIAFP